MDKIKNLFKTKDALNPADAQIVARGSNVKEVEETYRAWGVRWSGNAGGNINALNPALQSCYTQNVNEQNQNQELQEKNQSNIQKQIATKQSQRDGLQVQIDSKIRHKERLEEEIQSYRDKIDEINSNDKVNIMAKVNFSIGLIITALLAIYLFVFYSSASFSAFFGNNDISGAGEAIFDAHCYSEAVANGLGQLLFILLMPVIFLGLGFLIHQFGDVEKGWSKFIKIGALYVVTFIFDALLAFEISQKVYNYTVLSEEPYTVSMAFNSPNFWIVIFSGFVAYVIWGLVFDFTLQHFDNMNSHTKEIKVLEDKISNSKQQVDVIKKQIDQIQIQINNLETDIAALNTQLQNKSLIDKNILKQALSEFFTGWLSYMHLAAKSEGDQNIATDTYNTFITQL
ncbi:MAG: hypothetical protein HDS03_03865 [Bacteroides sp.]|nr:hypothetical protein [Bacteroides sp.]